MAARARTLVLPALLAPALLALAACGEPAAPPKPPAAPAPPVAPVPPATPEAPVAPTATSAPQPPTDAEVKARHTPHLQACLDTGDAAKGVTPAMAGCFNEELRLQDGALNAEYQRVVRAMPEARRLALRDVQRQWIKDRDATCAEAANSGGTIDMIDRPACLVDETIKRTIELERMPD